MKLGNKDGSDKNVLMPDIAKKNFGKVDLANCMMTQWIVHPTMVEFGETDKSLSKNGLTYPLLIMRIKVERRYQFYLLRIALILAVLSLSSLTSYAVDVGEVADRLSIDFTLLLTIVAFQQTVTDSLPVLPFVTIMDWYVMVAIGFVFMITLQHALMPADEEDLEELLVFIFGGVWVVAHLAFSIWCPVVAHKERKKLTMNTSTQELSDYNKDNDEVKSHQFQSDEKHIKAIENKEWVSFSSKAQ